MIVPIGARELSSLIRSSTKVGVGSRNVHPDGSSEIRSVHQLTVAAALGRGTVRPNSSLFAIATMMPMVMINLSG
jgi:hypothetical protein